jgi:hypothetical protein
MFRSTNSNSTLVLLIDLTYPNLTSTFYLNQEALLNSVRLSVSLSVRPSVCLFLLLSFFRFVNNLLPLICLSVCLSVCLFVCHLSVCHLSVCPSILIILVHKELKSSVKIEIRCMVKKLETILVLEKRKKERKKALVEININ